MTMKKIALEEHFITAPFEEYETNIQEGRKAAASTDINLRLPEFDQLRLEAMDRAGIEISVLSMTSPGLQAEKNAAIARQKAVEANDFLAAVIARHPKRFAGFAHLALHEPDDAVRELRRCVKEHNFKGAMINGHTNGVYLDDKRYEGFWEAVADLDVPVYLHPADAYEMPQSYLDYPMLRGAMWGWGVETATHALRLILSGLFDRLPTVKIILGHMGESLPFMLWRLDSRFQLSEPTRPLQKLPSQYIRENLIVTTSGACDNAPLQCCLAAMGEDNVLFSTDYPFESAQIAADFIEAAPLSESLRAKICYQNAKRVLKL
jgi:2,3-dihydroxybenzoate decarboxylase